MQIMEIEKLPDEYAYVECPNTTGISFRIKEVTDETSAKSWLKKLSEKTKVTWRIQKTYPAAGRINVYRLDLRCQHSTDVRVKRLLPSKNTDCPARLNIIVQRFIPNSRSKKSDPQQKDYPCVVTFKEQHNHDLHSADVLRYRDMSSETRARFCTLFRQGHNPSSAFKAYKLEMMQKHGFDYNSVAADGSVMPSLSQVNNFFQNLNVSMEKLEDIFQRIEEGMLETPEVFLPAVTKMVANAEKFASTQSGLISAMRTFGTYSELLSNKQKGLKGVACRCHGSKIGVQQTSLGSGELCLTGKQRAGQPSDCATFSKKLSDHAYASFGHVPARKRKSPLNLQQCTNDDSALEGVKNIKMDHE